MIEGYHGSPTMGAVILAGGYGKRMGALTEDTQKCILPIDGKPTLIHIMERLVTAFGSVDAKLAVAYKAEKVREIVEKQKPANVHVEYVKDEGGVESDGIFKGMRGHTNGGVFLSMPGDVIADPSLYTELVEAYEKTKYPIVAASATEVNEVRTHCLFTTAHEQVTDIVLPPASFRDPLPHETRDMNIYAQDARMYAIADRYPAINKIHSSSLKASLQHGEPMGSVIYQRPWIHLADATDLRKSARALHI